MLLHCHMCQILLRGHLTSPVTEAALRTVKTLKDGAILQRKLGRAFTVLAL